MFKRLTDRTAVITGAASGIGHATAELFAAHGARVLAVDLPGAAMDFSSDAIEPFGADIAAADTPGRIAAAVTERFGKIDILYNNAAIDRRASIETMTDAFWDTMFDVSLKAGFRIVRELIPLLRESPGGRIISTSSVSALRAVPGQAAYASAKAGLIAFGRALALELGPDNITSNLILPGPILSGMTKDFLNSETDVEWRKRCPLGRIGLPDDVAKVALFFASDDSAYVTGQALVVDGGLFIAA